MIDLTAKILGAESVTMRLASAPAAVLVRVRTEVERLGIELQRKVKESKLTGQVLKVKTGRLRRSINLKVTEGGNSITGAWAPMWPTPAGSRSAAPGARM